MNPRSNRPDRAAGEELARLMWNFSGHAKASSLLESVGMRAKTLDQNRSKIKDEIVAALGAELASRYLFEQRRDPRSSRMSYRLGLRAEQLVIHPSTDA